MRWRWIPLALFVGALTACSQTQAVSDDARVEIPAISVTEFRTLLANSEKPLVVNIWASWCVPCRSEAPLLRAAHAEYGDRVRYVGIDVLDTQADGLAFLAEFGITYENYFDAQGEIPADLGGFGVPLTYFFAPGGEQIHLHAGVIDEQALALQIDELLARS